MHLCTGCINGHILFDPRVQQQSVLAIVDALEGDSFFDDILCLDHNAESQSNDAVESVSNGTRILAIGAFDYTDELLMHILDDASLTVFGIDQQPYLQGFLPLYLMGIQGMS